MHSRVGSALISALCCVLLPHPAMAGVSVTSGLTYKTTTQPGEDYEGVVQLRNNGLQPVEVKVYQTDYLFFHDGTNIYGDPGKDPRSNADWITFGPKRLTIPPQSGAQVHFSVQIPGDRALIGSYWSMLMVEGIPESSRESAQQEEDEITVGLRQVVRYGLQMITNIGTSGTSQLKFITTEVVREEGKRFLQTAVENVGEQLLTPEVSVELYDGHGTVVGTFGGGSSRTYPGTSVSFKIDLSKVPEGTYQGLVVADCGGDNLFGVTYTFAFHDSTPEANQTTDSLPPE